MRKRLISMLAVVASAFSGCLSYTAWTKVGGGDSYSGDTAATTFLAANLAGGMVLGASSNLALEMAGEDVTLEQYLTGTLIGGPAAISIADAMVALVIVVFSAPAHINHWP